METTTKDAKHTKRSSWVRSLRIGESNQSTGATFVFLVYFVVQTCEDFVRRSLTYGTANGGRMRWLRKRCGLRQE